MISRTFYSIRDGVLRVSGDDPSVEWEGRPDDLDVLDVKVLKGSEAAVVLLAAPRGHGRVRNLIRLERDGRIVWRGELPAQDPTDSFVDFDLDPGGDVLAWTWSGHSVRLAGHDGRLLSSSFGK